MPDPFITPQDLVDKLGRGNVDDPGVFIATDAACDMVRDVTELQINAGTTTEAFDGTGTDALLLPEFPINSAGTVLVNGGTVTDWVLDTRKGALIRKRPDPSSASWCSGAWPLVWPRGRQNITVTYSHGWADADIPQSIRLVALAVAERIFVQGPTTAETIGRQISVTYAGAATDFTTGELLILNSYRRMA